jgi:sec-independent protein translocase protein TatB
MPDNGSVPQSARCSPTLVALERLRRLGIMFGLGWQEILLILVVAVLVIGPDQLPQVARTMGRMIAQFRRITNELRDTVNKEFTENEDFKDFREFHQSVDAEFRDIGRAAHSYVEKEVAKEEEELRKLETEVRDATADPDKPTDEAAKPPDSYTYVPTDHEPAPATSTPAPEAAPQGAAAKGDGVAKSEPAPAEPSDDSPRKESA